MNISLKKAGNDINISIFENRESSFNNKMDLLDYATLKRLHSFQPDLELHEDKCSNDNLLISELQKLTEEPKK